MKHLTIVVPNGQNNLSSIIGSYKFFSQANALLVSKGKSPLFKIDLAGLSKNVKLYDGLFTITPHKRITEIKKTNLIIIPAIHRSFSDNVQKNARIIEWLNQQYKLGAEIASICTGAFLLASTGLLNGKSCSTHWNAEQPFTEMFPNVNLQTGRLITDESRLYTNGGAFAFLHLLLYLVEKNYGRDIALMCAKIFQIDVARSEQTMFTIFSAQKNHGDDVILKVQKLIEEKACDRMSIEEIADKFALSRRNLDRRFINATGITPLEYYQRVRIEHAKKVFENRLEPVEEVMHKVGYSDPKTFREIFRKFTGLSPLEYRNFYNASRRMR